MRQYLTGATCALYFVVAFWAAPRASAQQCDTSQQSECSMSEIIPASVMLGHPHPSKSWMFSYRFMHMQMQGVQSGTQHIDDQQVFAQYLTLPVKMSMNMHMIMAMYGLTPKLSLMLMMQYQQATMDMEMFATNTHQHSGSIDKHSDNHMHMSNAGLADTKLYMSYTLKHSHKASLISSLGLSIPTGNISATGNLESMYPNKRLPYMMQLGSGTLDVMPALTYLRFFPRMTLGIQVAGTYRPFYNMNGYSLGNDAFITSWYGINVNKQMALSVRVEGYYQQSLSGFDKEIQAYIEPAGHSQNYGGRFLKSFLGVNYHFKQGFLKNNKLAIEVGYPVYQSLNGVQLAAQTNIHAAWLYSF